MMTKLESCTRVTFGTQRRQVEAGEFLLTESEYAPGFRTEAHAHRSTSLVFGLQGALEHVNRAGEGELRPGSVLILPRDVVHADRVSNAGCSCFFVTLSPTALQRVTQCSPVLESIRIASSARIEFIRASLQHESMIDDTLRVLAIEGLVYELIASLAREPGPGRERAAPWLRAVRDQLEAQFLAPPTLTALASSAGVHPQYLLRAFARHYGDTIGSFVRRRRIEWSMRALQQTTGTIAQIAQQAGFFDQSHFTRCFKHQVGITPARYRRENLLHGTSGGTYDPYRATASSAAF
jgi:AraC-like DNA-binding protein/quercetin dioxygenase-like cupin family protein